jgi:hypothetical protein
MMHEEASPASLSVPSSSSSAAVVVANANPSSPSSHQQQQVIEVIISDPLSNSEEIHTASFSPNSSAGK